MKYSPLFVLVLMLGLFSCKKQGNTDDVVGAISVSPTSLSVPSAGGTFDVELKANKAWQVESATPWLSVSPNRGNGNSTVQITVSANRDVARDAKVVFNMLLDKKSATVDIAQETGISADGIMNVTISEFISKKDSETDWYRLTGEIVSISNYTYGNLYLKDDTGFIYVYGLAPTKGGASEDFKTLNLKPSDVVTLVAHRKTYNKINETDKAYYESHTSDKSYPGFSAKSAKATWLELPATTDEADGNVFIHHRQDDGQRNYSAYFSTGDRVSRWTCYPYVQGQGAEGRNNDPYAFDPLVPIEHQATLTKSYHDRTFDDIPGEEFIRGHMVPSNDRSDRANYDVFLATNIMPQSNKLNSNLWSDLEYKIHSRWSSQSDTLYVVTGTVIDDSTHKVKDVEGKEITVPTIIYKAVLALTKQKEYKAVGAYFDNKNNASSSFSKSMAVSIDKLEELIGTDLFVNLPDDVEKAVEAADPAKDNWWWQ